MTELALLLPNLMGMSNALASERSQGVVVAISLALLRGQTRPRKSRMTMMMTRISTMRPPPMYMVDS